MTSAEDESLHNLLANNLLKFKAELQELSDAASREHALEKQLDKMQADWVRFERGPPRHLFCCADSLQSRPSMCKRWM